MHYKRKQGMGGRRGLVRCIGNARSYSPPSMRSEYWGLHRKCGTRETSREDGDPGMERKTEDIGVGWGVVCFLGSEAGNILA